jgi:CRISPR-associated protein Cas1
MISQLNTLFVTADGAYLHKDHETLVVKQEGEVRMQVPLLHLSGVICFGRAILSPDLMAACAERRIHVAFLSSGGEFFARIEGVPGGNVLLRRQQYRAADDSKMTLELARSIVIGKVANARRFLLHARRDVTDEARRANLEDAATRLGHDLGALERADRLDEVRGLEGMAARTYFGVFSLLFKQHEEEFRINGRTRRPPRDRTNALLSFGYTLLMQDCAAAAAGVGLDPAVGYLHEERPGRLGLALDLMEELRVPMVDRLVVALVNRRQIQPSDLIEDPTGAWRLTPEGRRTFLVAYQEAKQANVRHPFLEQMTVWGRAPHIQALLLARTLRRDLDLYPPFVIR